jgi:hypothetical protein
VGLSESSSELAPSYLGQGISAFERRVFLSISRTVKLGKVLSSFIRVEEHAMLIVCAVEPLISFLGHLSQGVLKVNVPCR